MATLYVENVPEELYDALKQRARGRRKSDFGGGAGIVIGAHPHRSGIGAPPELAAAGAQIQRSSSTVKLPFPSSEEMQREDRGR